MPITSPPAIAIVFSAVALIGTLTTIFVSLVNYFRGKHQVAHDDKRLLIDTETAYIEKINSFKQEISDLQSRITSIEQKLSMREKEILHIEAQRISAFLRVSELEKENEQLKRSICITANCDLRKVK